MIGSQDFPQAATGQTRLGELPTPKRGAPGESRTLPTGAGDSGSELGYGGEAAPRLQTRTFLSRSASSNGCSSSGLGPWEVRVPLAWHVPAIGLEDASSALHYKTLILPCRRTRYPDLLRLDFLRLAPPPKQLLT